MKYRLVAVIFFSLITCHSQTDNHLVFNLQQCIDFALEHNQNIKTGMLELDFEKQSKKSVNEIPKTNFLYTQGQFNSVYKSDNSITIAQTIPFPSVFSAHHSLSNSQINSSNFKLQAGKADLIFQIKSTYYALLFHYNTLHLLLKEDSIYENFAIQSRLKFESGKGSILEKTASETKVLEIKNLILEKEIDIETDHIQLQTLLNSSIQVDAVKEDLSLHPLQILMDTSNFVAHPHLLFYKEQILVNDKLTKLERNKILPDLAIGYTNLSIYGPADIGDGPYSLTTKDRLQALSVGLNIPLWIHPSFSKVKATHLRTEIAKSDYNYHVSLFKSQINQTFNLYLKYQKSIVYYKGTALTNSRAIITQALSAYKSNEISYVEYLDVVSNALNIESNYLNVIYQNDLTVLKMEYLKAR